MTIEQYIVRELKADIKLLISKVTELERKLEEAHPSQIKSAQDLVKKMKENKDDTFKRYEGYSEWDKTHDNYKTLYAPDGQDEHGKKIKDD
jgi:hypothetical protein